MMAVKKGTESMKKGLFCGRGRGSAFSFCLAKKKTLAKEKGAWGDFEFPPGPPESDQENHFGFPGPFLRRVPAWRNHCRALHPEAKRDGTQAVPYAEIGIFTECSEQFRRGRPMCRPAVRTQANPYKLPSSLGSRFTRPIQTQLRSILAPIVERRVVRC